MITEIDSVFRADAETFDLYLVFRDVLSNKLEIDGSWIQIFSIDFEEIRKKLRVGMLHEGRGWQEEHINCLPRVLRKLKNMGLIRRLSVKEFLAAAKHLIKKGRFPKKLYKIKWAESDRFFTPDGIPLLGTRKTPLQRLLYEKLKSEA